MKQVPQRIPSTGLELQPAGVTGRCLTDVLLIIEDLLIMARHLADSGAPTEAVEAILDQVAALRESRG